MGLGNTFVVVRNDQMRKEIAAFVACMDRAVMYDELPPLRMYHDSTLDDVWHQKRLKAEADHVVAVINDVSLQSRQLVNVVAGAGVPWTLLVKAANPEIWREVVKMRLQKFPPVIAVGAPNKVDKFFKEAEVNASILTPFDLEHGLHQIVEWIEKMAQPPN